MASYGYARVSTEDQDLTVQLEKLKAAGCDIVRAEKALGKGASAIARELGIGRASVYRVLGAESA